MKRIRSKKDDKMVRWQSKLTFNGFHESHTKNDSYTIKQNEVRVDKPIYLGFAVLD